MKKIFIILMSLILLTGCQSDNNNDVNLYNDMIDILVETEDYLTESKYFTITHEVVDTEDGRRFYIVIDNPTIAMYDVNTIAFAEGSDIENEFIPNAGIFEGDIFLVPHQVNKEEGYVKGISISGLCSNESNIIYCLVQWKDPNNVKTYRECFKINIS